MPIDPHNLQPQAPEQESILDQEAEAAPAEESLSADAEQQPAAETAASPEMGLGAELAPAFEEENAAPFAAAESDPGLETNAEILAGSEEEAAPAPEPLVYRELSGPQLQAAVEATLFVHHKPISVSRIRELVNPEIDEEDYRSAISNLMASYFDDSRGMELVEVAGGYQLRTKQENKDILRRMYQITPMKLTNAMLEVLAIVAYNQPITREGVDKVRGVDSSHLVRVLLDKKMLRIVGKSDELGRPMIYGTTKEFLELFGLRDLSALPTLRELEDMLPKSEAGSISEEEALAKEMEGIVEESKPLEFNDLELQELEAHETQKVPEKNLPATAHGHSGAPEHGSPQAGAEAHGDLDLPPEIAGRLTPGQEGNA
jgi:segregation and condensation protein B